jgi:hypothetical protein
MMQFHASSGQNFFAGEEVLIMPVPANGDDVGMLNEKEMIRAETELSIRRRFRLDGEGV